jgi:hypothetical protein
MEKISQSWVMLARIISGGWGRNGAIPNPAGEGRNSRESDDADGVGAMTWQMVNNYGLNSIPLIRCGRV